MNPRFNNIHKVSDVIDTMIKGLKREWVKINMTTYGDIRSGICVGCAATNALCELMHEPFSVCNIQEREVLFNYGIDDLDLHNFERAINELRQGHLNEFCCLLGNISHITGLDITRESRIIICSYIRSENIFRKKRWLPELATDNYKDNLHYYEKFRDWLIKEGL